MEPIKIELWTRHFEDRTWEGHQCPLGAAVKEQRNLPQYPTMGAFGLHIGDQHYVIYKDKHQGEMGYCFHDYLKDKHVFNTTRIGEDNLVRTVYLHPINLNNG